MFTIVYNWALVATFCAHVTPAVVQAIKCASVDVCHLPATVVVILANVHPLSLATRDPAV